MRIPGGIRVRIALALVAIVAVALGAAYVIVVPSLEHRLVEARTAELQGLAVPLSKTFPTDHVLWQQKVEAYAVTTNARVIAFETLAKAPPALAVIADSQRDSSRDVANDPVALRALVSGEVETGRVVESSGDYANVAVPLESGSVLLFEAPLADSLATVHLVERRLLLATGFALLLAAALGLSASALLANRLRRLENAAERIAGGDFDVPIIDRGDDEIGQLAVAFDRMRIRLSQLDTARKEFVANASHELRTPLFSLGGFLELLTDEDLDDETRRRFLETMQEQVARLAKLSTDLLDLSRVDAGQLRVAQDPVDLGELARSLVDELEPMRAASGHVLESDAQGEVWALGDEERVLQVARALVVNALSHTPSGTRVTVRVQRRGERAELSVVDDGPGIPATQREAVFDRFYRVEGGIASGSGLGLAIAKELARLMGGSVRLESRPGRTVFTLDLVGEGPPDIGSTAAPAFSRENAGRP
ncbi:MAG TPA: ATP-binding protein [Gaiellaceae bacterium]|nr:ATP-binding protein [Gaiellaceae bacterium]